MKNTAKNYLPISHLVLSFVAILSTSLSTSVSAQVKPMGTIGAESAIEKAMVGEVVQYQDASGSLHVRRDSATVYRQVSPDGGIYYTDKPVKGQKIDKIIEVDLRSTSTWSTDLGAAPSGIQGSRPAIYERPVSKQNHLAAERLIQKQTTEADAVRRLQLAESRFEKANEVLKNSETPQEGERSRNVNGTSRLNEMYLDRQDKANAEAKAAALEYDEAISALRAAQR